MNTGVKPLAVDDIRRVSRHEKNDQTGTYANGQFCQTATVHAAHDDVGQEQMDGAIVFTADLDGGFSIGSGESFVSFALQHVDRHFANVRIIFDHENSFVTVFR